MDATTGKSNMEKMFKNLFLLKHFMHTEVISCSLGSLFSYALPLKFEINLNVFFLFSDMEYETRSLCT
jgi:hypothetical protein